MNYFRLAMLILGLSLLAFQEPRSEFSETMRSLCNETFGGSTICQM